MTAKHARPTRAQARAGAYARQPTPRQPRDPARRQAAHGRPLTRGERVVRRARTTLAGASVIAGASILGVLGGSGTFALWANDAPVAGGSVTVAGGTSELTVNPAALTTPDMLPNESITDSFTLTNGGTVALAVTPTVASTSSRFTLRIRIMDASTPSNGACPAPTTFLPDPAVGTASDPLIPAVTLDAGQSRLVCATVTASSALVPGDQAFPFAVTFDGVQP